MSNTTNTTDRAQYEQSCLDALEAQSKAALNWFQTALPSNRAATPAEIATVLQYAGQMAQYYASFEPIATQLATSGLTRLSQRLQQLESDLRTAQQTYWEIYQSAVGAIAATTEYQRQVQQDILKMQSDTIKHRQEVFDEMNQRFIDSLRS